MSLLKTHKDGLFDEIAKIKNYPDLCKRFGLTEYLELKLQTIPNL
jgi:hypothetical protein